MPAPDDAPLGSLPLRGTRVLVTRAKSGADALSALLAERGAEVVSLPVTRIEAVDPAALHAAIARLDTYDWAVFTSRNAVTMFFDALRSAGRDASAWSRLCVAAVGPSTAAALAEHGVAVTLTPERFIAEGVLDAMRRRGDVNGARVLYATAEGARDVLPVGLTALGATVDRVEIYRSAPATEGAAGIRERLLRRDIDVVTFTAGSAVHAFVGAVGADAARGATTASIGPATSEAIREAGLPVDAEAAESTIPGLVAAVCALVARRRGAVGHSPT